jgi:hypothetical protein
MGAARRVGSLSGGVPDIACGYYLGDTSCVLPWKHDGDHEPARVVLVDRRLSPLNGRYVVRVKGAGPADHRQDLRDLDFASVHQYKGRERVFLESNVEDDQRGTEIRSVNRPAVRVGDRWLRRCPNLEVVAAR